MKTILILAVSALCIFSAKADDDDYATIVRYLGENGHYIISPDEVAKVRAYMKANGYQHTFRRSLKVPLLLEMLSPSQPRQKLCHQVRQLLT